MSLGYVGMCRKVAEDDRMVIYSYAGENWNDGGKSKHGDSHLQDGFFTIHKDFFGVDLDGRIRTGKIIIDRECKNAFHKPGVLCDYIAWQLLNHIFAQFEKNRHFPEQKTFIQ